MKYYKYIMNMKDFNILSIILFIPLIFLIYFFDLWGIVDIYFFLWYFLWMFLHELLHGVGFSLNKNINHRNIVYGACLEKGILYCMCKQVVSKKCIITSLIFPFFLIGFLTLFLGILFNNGLLMLLSLFNIIGCIGDIIMFLFFIKLPNFQYVDLDDCTSFILISDTDLSNYKMFGLKLIETDNYECLDKPYNYNKFNISTFSFVMFFILIGVLLVKIISSFVI